MGDEKTDELIGNMKLHKVLFLLIFLIGVNTTFGQSDTSEISDLERTFMPAVQMGYVAQGTSELSGGLMTQTSLEYRDISNFVFRINYDAFNANLKVSYPIDTNVTYTGKTVLSDLIIGVGYRIPLKKHFITNYIQSGVKFYGFPVFNQDAATINFDMNARKVGVIRYSLGYEYQITPKLFFAVELLTGYVFKAVDFWKDNRWSYGVTIGLSAPI